MNSVNLVGNLVREPELKYSASGVAICKFTIAINRFVKQGEEQKADFIQILTFNKTAENVANYTTKGSKVAVTGSISTGSYDDKEGKKVYTFEVLAQNVQFLTRKDDGQQPQQPQQQHSIQQPMNPQFVQQQQQQVSRHEGNQFYQQQQPQYQQPMNQQQAQQFTQQMGATYVNNDPFAQSKGPIDVNEENLPF